MRPGFIMPLTLNYYLKLLSEQFASAAVGSTLIDAFIKKERQK